MGKGRKQPKAELIAKAKAAASRVPASVPRVLVVTAYYREERALIERTMRSVRAQTVVASGAAVVDHLLVADGFPQAWIDEAGVRHVRLDRAHGDYGNTPRGVGSVLAISEGYDAICYCDADNWYEPTHVEDCLKAAAAGGEATGYVIARRIMRRPDESVIPIADEPITTHVDTNCFFFLPPSFHLIHHFAAIPRQMSVIGDRLFFAALRVAGLKVAVLTRPSVDYHCLWDPIYRAIGETPPEGSKPAADQSSADRWLGSLSHRDKVIVSRLTGLPFAAEGEDDAGPGLPERPRVLVITAYHKEERALLEACLAGVRAQTAVASGAAEVDHMVVADGFPQGWLDEVAGLRHVRLDRAHGDYGNTPRGVGSLLAISEGYDAFFYLDADNGLRPDHIEACLAAARRRGPDCDWVMARRHLCRPDGTALPFAIDDADVDTNCFFFLRGSFHLVHHFAAIPREMSAIGDRIFHMMLTGHGLKHATVPHRTVDYLCLWREPYELAGEAPPADAKPPIDQAAIRAWYDGLPPRRHEVVSRLIGFKFAG